MKYVESIEIIFENCEVSEKINEDDIGYFIIDDLEPLIMRTACNSIERYEIAHNIEIWLKNTADKPIKTLDDSRVTLFERIKAHSDITHIQVNYKDGTSDYICVDYDYEDKDDYIGDNLNQKIEHKLNEYLIIKIKGVKK